jgi:NADPH:quinone reductase-like Zn-dependent oxidoreductase
MKAIVYESYGGPDVLRLEEVERPTPKGDQVLVKISAVSVNAPDWRLMRATPFLARMHSGLFRPKFAILGCDIAGTIEAAGPEAKQLRAGDEVFGDLARFGYGGFAEYVSTTERAFVRKPAGITFEVAAHHVADPVVVLHDKRLVEMHLHAHLLHLLLRGQEPERRAGRVARHDACDCED